MRRLLCFLLVLLTGCSLRLPGMAPLGRDVPLVLTISKPQHVASASETSLKVTIGSPYRTLAVPTGWDKAEIELGNATLLAASQSATINQAGGDTASAVFTGLRPGTGYSLTVALYTGTTLKARGANGSFSLSPGSQEVTVSMTVTEGFTRIQAVAHAVAPSLNTQATDFSVRSPRDLAMGPDGSLYVLTQSPAAVYRRAPNGVLTLVGGSQDERGFSGDGGPATQAYFRSPRGIAVDAAGNVYLADTDNYRIRRIAAGTGLVTTVAGTGAQETSGDGGPASAAGLYDPTALAFDASGNLYIAQGGQWRIRKIDTNGDISTFAGADGWSVGGDGGQAIDAILGEINDMAFSADGALYFTVTNDNLVRRIASNGVITTIAGNGVWDDTGDGGDAVAASLNNPAGIAVDAAGNVYVATNYGFKVRRIGTDGKIATFAGGGAPAGNGDGGLATDALLTAPFGLVLDADGNLYIADTEAHRVRQVDGDTGVIQTMVGNGYAFYSGDGGPATRAQFHSPTDVLVADDGTMYISENGNQRIRKVAPNGTVTTLAGTGTNGYNGDNIPASTAQLDSPRNLCFDPDGNLVFCDSVSNRVRKIDLSTGIITTLAGTGNWGFAGDGLQAVDAELANPRGVAYDASGSLYIGDNGNNRVRRVDGAGVITTIAGTGNSGPTDDGNDGDDGDPLLANLGSIRDLTIDPDGHLVLAVGNMVRKIDLEAGTITAVAGAPTSGFGGMGGLATAATLDYVVGVDYDSQGNLYIAAQDNYRVLRVTPAGIIGVIAGNGNEGAGGDGGSPLSASFDYLMGIDVDSQGRVYVADMDSRLVQRIE